MSFSLEIRILTGAYRATAYNDRTRHEWPPHPSRVFSALVAARGESEDPSDASARALDWLARAGPPEILAADASPRKMSLVYVPTNDVTALTSIDGPLEKLEEALAAARERGAKPAARRAVDRAEANLAKRSLATSVADGKGTPRNAAQVLSARPRQPRTFPAAIPESPVVVLRWSADPPPDILEALDDLASRVARLGHSASLVSLRATAADAITDLPRRWVPDPSGNEYLRVPLDDQRALLEAAHARHRGIEPRMLPTGFERYGEASDDRPGEVLTTPFDDRGWVVFQVVGEDRARPRRVDLSLAQHATRALRGTLLAAVDGDWPETLSGHQPDGVPSRQPHLAVVGLGDVGHPHASGTLMGLALVPPRDLTDHDRRDLLTAIGKAEGAAGGQQTGDPSPPALRLTLGRHGTLAVRRLVDLASTRGLRSLRWVGPARRWASATAVALGRNPGDLQSRDPDDAARAEAHAIQTLSEDCLRAGLPEPEAIWLHRRSLLAGAPRASRFTPFPLGGHGPKRVCVHAEILFPEPVQGPLILGAGRFFGIGLFAPRDRR